MILLTLASRYLAGRKLRTFLTTLSIVLGVMLIFSLNGMVPAFAESFRQNMLAAAGKVDLAITHVTNGSFSSQLLETVRSVPGISRLSGSLRKNVSLPVPPSSSSISGKNLSTVSAVTVAGVDPLTAQEVRAYTLLDGRFLQPGDGNVIVVSESLAITLQLKLGDRFTLPAASGSTDFELVGILTARALPSVEEVYVPLQAAQALFDEPGQINTIEALFSTNADPNTVERAVQTALGPDFKLGALEAGAGLLASLKIAMIAINLFGVMALAMGAFIIFNTFRTIVTERKRDFGMLRAVGASQRAILGMVVMESLLQGLMGTILGVACGYFFVLLIMSSMNKIAMQFIHFRLQGPAFTLPVFLLSAGLGIGVTLLGGLFPALTASRISPLDALRPTTGEIYFRTSSRGAIAGAVMLVLAALGLVTGIASLVALGTLLFLVGLVLIAPALIRPLSGLFGRLLGLIFAREGHLAQGNLARQPGRAAITASAMMIGLAILLSLAGVVTSTFTGFIGYLDKSLGADFLLIPQSLVLSAGNVGASPELADKIRRISGIAGITTLRLGMTEANGTQLQLVGIDPATYQMVSGLEFMSGDERAAYADLGQGRVLIVNGIFAAQHRLQVGDTLTIKTLVGDQTYRVAAIGMDYLNAKLATAYISQENLAQDFHQTSDVMLMADLSPAADAASVKASLEELVKGYPAFTLFSSADWRASQKAIFDQAMWFLYILMIALACPSLIALVNTLAINVLERRREIGVLRAVGSTRRQVQRMILAESLLLSAVGIAFGILSGLWLGYVFVIGMDISGFKLPYYFPYTGLLVTIAVGLLFGVLASIIPARQAARLEIVQALRYE